MKLLRVLSLAGLGLIGSAQAYNVNLTNKTDYSIKMTVNTATAGTSFNTQVSRPDDKEKGAEGSVTTGGNCPTYIKLEFYDNGEKLPLEKLKLQGDYDIDEGNVWYNLGNLWGNFYCGNLYLTAQQMKGGAIEINAE